VSSSLPSRAIAGDSRRPPGELGTVTLPPSSSRIQPLTALRLTRQAELDAAEGQAVLDQQWQQLLGNDTDTVIATLAEAFEDNEAPSRGSTLPFSGVRWQETDAATILQNTASELTATSADPPTPSH
jgi:hypothetical protein